MSDFDSQRDFRNQGQRRVRVDNQETKRPARDSAPKSRAGRSTPSRQPKASSRQRRDEGSRSVDHVAPRANRQNARNRSDRSAARRAPASRGDRVTGSSRRTHENTYSTKGLTIGPLNSSRHGSVHRGSAESAQRRRNQSARSASCQPNRKGFGRGVLELVLSLLAALLTFFAALVSAALGFFARSRALSIAAIVLAVVVLGGVGDTLIHYNKVYSGVHIGSMDVSGMTREEVAALLDDTYADKVSQGQVVYYANEEAMRIQQESNAQQEGSVADEIALEEAQANKQLWRTSAASLHAVVPSEDLANEAFAFGRTNGGLLSRLGAKVFDKEIPFILNFDEAQLEAFASDIDATVGIPRIDYGVAVNQGIAEVTPGNDGEILNRDLLKQQLTDAFAGTNGGASEYVAYVEHAPVRIDQKAAQKTCDEVNAAIERGGRFSCEGITWDVSREDLGSWVITSIQEDSKGRYFLQPSFDDSVAKPAIVKNIELSEGEQNLTVRFEKTENDEVLVFAQGSMSIPQLSHTVQQMNEVVFGLQLEQDEGSQSQETQDDSAEQAASVVEASADDPIVVQVALGPLPESMTFDEALQLGVVQAISSYTTEYSTGDGTENRNHNIHLGGDKINNSIAKSGTQWSFQDTVGEVEEETGFLPAGAILGDEVVDEAGGGICQVATTVFNAIYEAGYPIPVRHNHTMYMASYPAGRDAAVAWPDMDLIWENNSSSDILVTSTYTESSITVTLYGIDPGYTVETQDGEWTEGDEYAVKVSVNEQISPDYAYIKTYGQDGSSFWVVRTVIDEAGNVVSTDRFDSVYLPKNEIIEAGSQEAGDKLKKQREKKEE